MEVYTDWKTEGDLEIGVALSRILTQGYQGLYVRLPRLRPAWTARRLHLSELLEDHRGLKPPILSANYDLIRNNLEDSNRLVEELAWMGAEGFPMLVATVTQGARSHQIEDQELLLVMRAVKRACEAAEKHQVRFSVKITPKHVADSMASALRFLREGRHESMGLWLDTPGMEGDGQLDPALGVRSLAKHLHGIEVGHTMKAADDFLPWLKTAAIGPQTVVLVRDGQGDGLAYYQKHFPPPKSAAKRAEEEKREKRSETRKTVKDIFPF